MKKRTLIFSVFFVALFLFSNSVDALTIYSQSDHSTKINTAGTNNIIPNSTTLACFDIASSTANLTSVSYYVGTFGETINARINNIFTYASNDCSGSSLDNYNDPSINHVGVTDNTLITDDVSGANINLTGVGSVVVYVARTGGTACSGASFACASYGTAGGSYYMILTDDGELPDFTTHFETFTPTLGTTTPVATSTAFEFGATGYVNEDDFVATSTVLHIRFRQQTGMGIRGNSLIATGGDFYIPVTESGDFDLSTTTSVLSSGVYNAYYAIEIPRFTLFGFNFLTNTIVSAVGTFVVGEATQSEIISVEILTNTTGGGIPDTVVPTEETASSTILGLGNVFGVTDIVLSKFPINWFVEYANVLQGLGDLTTSTSSPEAEIDYSHLILIQNIPTTTAANLTFTFFSSTTFAQVGALPGISFMRTLLGWVLWIGLVMYAWRRSSMLFSHNQS